jgi:hypothetical protein
VFSILNKWFPLVSVAELGRVLVVAGFVISTICLNFGKLFVWLLLQVQQFLFCSVSLKNGKGLAFKGTAPKPQAQHSTLGTQLGFSQTNSHLGLGHAGLVHFQSHLGSSQTGSHSGLGA